MFNSESLVNNKFWHGKRMGNRTFIRWGKLGAKNPQSLDKVHVDVAAAGKNLEKSYRSKLNKGYIEYNHGKLNKEQ